MCDLACMNGLEDASIYHQLLTRVPEALVWAVMEELDSGLELSVTSELGDAISRSSGRLPFAAGWSSTGPSGFVTVGVVDSRRLRLGVQRLLSGLVSADPDLVFILKGATAEELPDKVVDLVVQAGMWGVVIW